MWRKDTKPTPANIRKRIASAQEALDAALDLLKKNERLWPTDAKGKRFAVPIINAQDWLVVAQRRLTTRP